jgi:hypothetical protein
VGHLHTQEVKRVAKDGVVLLALSNAGYIDLLLNWKASVDRLNITNYIILPNDVLAAQKLSYLGTYPCAPHHRTHTSDVACVSHMGVCACAQGIQWAYHPAIGLDDTSSSEAERIIDEGDPEHKKWNKVVHKKVAYVRAVLDMGYNVLVSTSLSLSLLRASFAGDDHVWRFR